MCWTPRCTGGATADGVAPIVRLNPAYFDHGASPAAVQLMVTGTEQAYAAERGARPSDPNFQLLESIREKLHWSALAAMVH